MTSIVTITSKPVRQILDAHQLGAATVLDEAGELRIFLHAEPASAMEVHVATSELEAATGRVVQIATRESLNPAQQAQLDRVGTVI